VAAAASTPATSRTSIGWSLQPIGASVTPKRPRAKHRIRSWNCVARKSDHGTKALLDDGLLRDLGPVGWSSWSHHQTWPGQIGTNR
jgi:hypothetical protein